MNKLQVKKRKRRSFSQCNLHTYLKCWFSKLCFSKMNIYLTLKRKEMSHRAKLLTLICLCKIWEIERICISLIFYGSINSISLNIQINWNFNCFSLINLRIFLDIWINVYFISQNVENVLFSKFLEIISRKRLLFRCFYMENIYIFFLFSNSILKSSQIYKLFITMNIEYDKNF